VTGFLKTLTWHRPFKCDVLIVDNIGAQWLIRCIPEELAYRELNIRKRILFADFRFFLRMLRLLLQQDITESGRFGNAWIGALIDTVSPRLVLSFADNNAQLAWYSRIQTRVPVFFIQNAIRDTAGSFVRDRDLPNYFAFGEVEREIFSQLAIKCETYRIIGSLKLGFALLQSPAEQFPHFDFAFISHYRPEMESEGCSRIQSRIKQCQQRLFSFLCEHAAQRNLSTTVILKTRAPDAQQKEQEYFLRLSRGYAISFVSADKAGRELDSYYAGLSSTIIVHPGSTLGFELFAAGKKVLFGAGIDPKLISSWGVDFYFRRLPDLVSLSSSCDQAEFDRRCDQLRGMADEEYESLITESASSIVSICASSLPHLKVKEEIKLTLRLSGTPPLK
jgi:surface carbohydrate biosynthesis protein